MKSSSQTKASTLQYSSNEVAASRPRAIHFVLSFLVMVAWALWFGGLITLFLVVTQLSKIFVDRRDIFGQAGSGTFIMFERYQLVVGALALLSALALRVVNPGVVRTAFFSILFLAAVGAVASPMWITPKIEALRQSGETSSPKFKKLHGVSMMVYSADALILLVAGTLLPAVINKENA